MSTEEHVFLDSMEESELVETFFITDDPEGARKYATIIAVPKARFDEYEEARQCVFRIEEEFQNLKEAQDRVMPVKS